MKDNVIYIAKFFEDLPEPELAKVFPAFIIGSFYNMLSEKSLLNHTNKAAFWTAIWTYSQASGQVSVFDHFLAVFKIYVRAAADNLKKNFPTATVSATLCSKAGI